MARYEAGTAGTDYVIVNRIVTTGAHARGQRGAAMQEHWCLMRMRSE